MVTLIDNTIQKALTTLSRAKAFLSISGDSKDTVLTMLINQATGSIETFCKRRLLRQTYTNEIYDGTGSDTIVLRNFPVTAVAKLEVNVSGDASQSWEEIDTNLYVSYEDGRIVTGGCFKEGPKLYRVTYTAGYLIDFSQENVPASHNLPTEIEYACLKMVGAMLNTRSSEGLDSVKTGDLSMSFRAEIDKDKELQNILGQYQGITV
jgi:uncharacterized phiE125 gp8 family phage protein